MITVIHENLGFVLKIYAESRKAIRLQVLGRVRDVVLGSPGVKVELGPGRLETALESVLGRNTLDTVSGVDVLDQGDLEAGGTALARGNGGVGQEIFPNLSQPVSTFSKSCQEVIERQLTLNQRLPYLASTLSLLPSQFRYHLQRVAE